MDEDAKYLDEHLLWSWEKNVRRNGMHAANKSAIANTVYASGKRKRASEPAYAPIHSPATKWQLGCYVENGRLPPCLSRSMLPLFAEARAAIGS